MRRLNNARERHAKERTALLNQLQQFVFLTFPEFTRVLKTIFSKTSLYLLKKYTTPARIGNANPEELGEEMRHLSRGKFRTRDAEALINFARTTVGIQEGLQGLILDIQACSHPTRDAARFYSGHRERDGDHTKANTL